MSLELKDDSPPSYEEATQHDSEEQKHYKSVISLQKETIESLRRQLEKTKPDEREKRAIKNLEQFYLNRRSSDYYERLGLQQEIDEIEERQLSRLKQRHLERRLGIKKNLNGFMLFCRDNRVKFREKIPHLSPLESTRTMGEIWSQMRDAQTNEFKKYDALAKVDKARYLKERSLL